MELPVTLRSLLAQTVRPTQIRIYVPKGDRGEFEAAKAVANHPIANSLVDVFYVDDVGPGTKFLYTLKEFSSSSAPSPLLVVCDDDHFYPPHWLATLLSFAVSFPRTALGFRGWRVNADLTWGVIGRVETDKHVITGWEIAQPYRVSVITANSGYLLDAAWFKLAPDASVSGTIFEMLAVTSQNCAAVQADQSLWVRRFVDDIYMNGHLARLGIGRMVVPLHSMATIDFTRIHTLEVKMKDANLSREKANDAALIHFKSDLEKEGVFYHLSSTLEGQNIISQHPVSDVAKAFVWLREWMKQRQWDAGWI
jgi:hypothetical protein